MWSVGWKLWVPVFAVIVLAFANAGVVYAQASNAPADPHHPSAPAATGGMAEPRDGAMMPMRDGAAMPMMDMCRQMMGGPMMGMGADQKMDPKMMAHMLEMRGEMMKAMGEVMMKHGKMMDAGAGR